MDKLDLNRIAEIILQDGAGVLWEKLKSTYPVQYNMLLLASLEMQAKELENMKNVNSM